MNILLSGSHGLIGKALASCLEQKRHTIIRLVRTQTNNLTNTVFWDPEQSYLENEKLADIDVVFHLGAENIASKRWTPQFKAKIRDSRIMGTRLLAQSISRLLHPPQLFICASAIGYYGDQGDRQVDEKSPPGIGFLAEVCQAWEAQTEPLDESNTRVIHARFGMVLDFREGALAKMLWPFRLGFGGTIGTGNQYISWISLDDAVSSLCNFIEIESYQGAVNVVSPNAVTNLDFTRTLARFLKRPAFCALPTSVARLVFGQMADELLLSSIRVAPTKLLASSFQFQHPTLQQAFEALWHQFSEAK